MMCKLIYDKAAAGVQIRRRRSDMGLTQEQLAEKLDLTQRTITDLERGEVGMSIGTLMDICNVLNTTPNNILLPQEESDAEMDWLVHVLKSSSEHVRSTAMDIVRAYIKSL